MKSTRRNRRRTTTARSVAIAVTGVVVLAACSGSDRNASSPHTELPPPRDVLATEAAAVPPVSDRGAVADTEAAVAATVQADAVAETAAASAEYEAGPQSPRASRSRAPERPATGDSPYAPGHGGLAPEMYPSTTYPPVYPSPTYPPTPDVRSRDGGVNPTEFTDVDEVSTFALDVDTSSYTLSRALVEQGTLPSFENVRTEEFVNYFNQEYPSPKKGETFAIHVDGARVPFLAPNQRIVRVGIQAERIDRADRGPANLTFVIDTSGSMSDVNKLSMVKDSLRTLVDNLNGNDTIAIVAFSDYASVILGPTPADDRSRVLGAIENLTPGGSTNAEAGLVLGYEFAEQLRREDRRSSKDRPSIHRVVLASDGVANVGATGPEAILERIRAASKSGIDLVTIGVGTNGYNDEMMERLADGGNGFSAYVDAPFESDRLFRERLVSSLQNVARDAKVQVAFDPRAVSSYRLLGFENRAIADRDFRNDAVDAGEIGAGHSVTALYEVTLSSERDSDGRVRDDSDRAIASEIAKVRLRWNDIRAEKVREIEQQVRTERFASSLESADPRLALDITVAAYAEVLRRGPWSRVTTLADLAEHSKRLQPRLGGDPDVQEFVRLVGNAAALQTWR